MAQWCAVVRSGAQLCAVVRRGAQWCAVVRSGAQCAQWCAVVRSGENARLPPMCPGFASRTRRHMRVEFVVGSRPYSEGFFPGSPVFPPPQKSTFLNSNSIGNLRAPVLSVEDCYVLPSLKQSRFILFFRDYVVGHQVPQDISVQARDNLHLFKTSFLIRTC